jgi:hypothetical protein
MSDPVVPDFPTVQRKGSTTVGAVTQPVRILAQIALKSAVRMIIPALH